MIAIFAFLMFVVFIFGVPAMIILTIAGAIRACINKKRYNADFFPQEPRETIVIRPIYKD